MSKIEEPWQSKYVIIHACVWCYGAFYSNKTNKQKFFKMVLFPYTPSVHKTISVYNIFLFGTPSAISVLSDCPYADQMTGCTAVNCVRGRERECCDTCEQQKRFGGKKLDILVLWEH